MYDTNSPWMVLTHHELGLCGLSLMVGWREFEWKVPYDQMIRLNVESPWREKILGENTRRRLYDKEIADNSSLLRSHTM